MYFYNVFFIIFPFPKSKIHLCIRPLCLTPARQRGSWGVGVWQGRGSGHPCSTTYHPPFLCWWVAGGEHPVLGADFLFTFLWGHSAGWPRPSPPQLVCLSPAFYLNPLQPGLLKMMFLYNKTALSITHWGKHIFSYSITSVFDVSQVCF